MTSTLRITAWPVVAVAAALALAGCSQGGDGPAMSGSHSSVGSSDGETSSASPATGELAIPADADDETRKRYIEENALAACMRAQGFTYTPHVSQDNDPLADVDGRDYEAAKKYREKYGFGIYAGAVYRDDPTVWNSEAYNKKQEFNPDDAYLKALTPAQKKAYDKALGQHLPGQRTLSPGCQKDAMEKAYGSDALRGESDRQIAEDKERARAAQQALNGDPKLVSLAQKFASCLTAQGISVTTTQPTDIGDMVKFQLASQSPPSGTRSLGKSEAAAKLTREIDIAKKDLVCGKDFRAAYFPQLAKHPFEDVTG